MPPTPPPTPFDWLPVGFSFLRRNLLLIGFCGMAGLGLGLAYVVTAPQKYTAEATLLIDSRRAHPVRPQIISTDAQSESVFVESQVEVLRGDGTLRAVVERLKLDTDPRFAANAGGGGGPIQRLRQWVGRPDATVPLDAEQERRATALRTLSRMVTIQRIGVTSVVDIRVTTPGRQLSAELANAVAAVYVDQQLTGSADTNRRAGNWLQERIAELREQAVTADRLVQEFKAANSIVELGGTILNEQEIIGTNQLLGAGRARLAEAQARVLRSEVATLGSVLHGSAAEALQNAVITRLRQQYLDAARREAEFATRHGAAHGAASNLRIEMAELQRSIQNELARIAEVNRSELEVAESNLLALERQMETQISRIARLNVERSALRSLQSSADAYRGIFESFLQRYTQAMQDQSYPITDARMLAPAIPPLEKSHPRAMIVLAGSLLAGLAIGFALAVMRDALDRRVRLPMQLARAAGVSPVWVMRESPQLRVPLSWNWSGMFRSKPEGGPVVLPPAMVEAASSPTSPAAEVTYAIRGALARVTARGAEPRVIGISGIEGGEGCSLVASNLAASLAQSGKRVVLVVWDASTPSDGAGFALTDSRSGLEIMAVPTAADATPSSRWLSACGLLGKLRGTHDVVVVDLPSMLGLGGTVALSGVLDAVVVVARWGVTTETMVMEAMSRSAASDALVLGAVLNRCQIGKMRLYAAGSPSWTPVRQSETAVA